MKHRPETTWGKKALFYLADYNPSRESGQKLREELEIEAMEECRLVASHDFLKFVVLYNLRPTYSDCVLDPHTSIMSQESTRRFAFIHISWEHFPHWDSLFPSDINLCQVDKLTNILGNVWRYCQLIVRLKWLWEHPYVLKSLLPWNEMSMLLSCRLGCAI